jgi:hypothetical protein
LLRYIDYVKIWTLFIFIEWGYYWFLSVFIHEDWSFWLYNVLWAIRCLNHHSPEKQNHRRPVSVPVLYRDPEELADVIMKSVMLYHLLSAIWTLKKVNDVIQSEHKWLWIKGANGVSLRTKNDLPKFKKTDRKQKGEFLFALHVLFGTSVC